MQGGTADIIEELMRAALRFPVIVVSTFTSVMVDSARGLQRTIDSIERQSSDLFDTTRYGLEPSWEQQVQESSTRECSRPSGLGPNGEKLCSASQTQFNTNCNPEELTMSNDTHGSSFFSDRKFAKTYRFIVSHVGENAAHILDDGLEITDLDTDEKCLENDHRGPVLATIQAAIVANDPTILPAPWTPPAPPPANPYVNVPSYMVDTAGPTLIEPEDLEDNIKVNIQPISRERIQATTDDRKQSKALEGIAEAINEIQDKGLKTRNA